MLEALKRGWWLLVLRGVVAVAFGILAFARPNITLNALVLLFGAYALVNGLFVLGVALRAPRGMPGKGAMIFLGLLSAAAGVVTFFYPNITTISLLAVIAWWAILTGVFEIVTAIRLRKELTNEWLAILSGALSVAFGILVIVMPNAGALSIIWLIGTYAILFGIMLLALAFRLKGLVSTARTAPRVA